MSGLPYLLKLIEYKLKRFYDSLLCFYGQICLASHGEFNSNFLMCALHVFEVRMQCTLY